MLVTEADGARLRMETGMSSRRAPLPWPRQVAELADESHRAYLVALRAVDSPALAEEAVQEAYLRMLRRPLTGLGRAQAMVYLFKTARSVAINLAKAAHHRRDREEGHAMSLLGSEPSAPERAARAEAARAARAALGRLPPEEREAVSLCFEQDLSRQAAAEVLDVPERTLGDRVQRGLERLRVSLAGQGFAALTPLAIGAGLRELGVPPAPEGLSAAVGKVVSSAARKSLRLVRTGPAAKAGAGYGTAVTVGTVLAIAAGGIWWVYRPAPPPLAAPAVRPAAIPVEEPLYAKWSFENGPAKDLEVLRGTWEWKRPDPKSPGFMLVPPKEKLWVRLPTAVPAGPLAITVRCRSVGSGFWSVGGNWTAEQGELPCREWGRMFRGLGGRIVERIFFTGRHAVVSFEADGKAGHVSFIAEHRQAYPSRRVALWFTNMEVSEIELRSVRPEELPAQIRDPGQLILGMEGPEEVRKEIH